jgi:hypothetical protein
LLKSLRNEGGEKSLKTISGFRNTSHKKSQLIPELGRPGRKGVGKNCLENTQPVLWDDRERSQEKPRGRGQKCSCHRSVSFLQVTSTRRFSRV